MNKPAVAVKQRPYWHVDMKWVCGIGAFFALSAALVLVNLAILTERERAVELSATVIAGLFSRNGIEDAEGVEEFRRLAAAAPGDEVAPIPQYPWLKVSKDDAANLSPRELKVKIFRQLTEPIYDNGLSETARRVSDNPDEQQKFQKDAALLGLLTRSTHETLRQFALIAGLAATLFLVGAVLFSAGWGRLVTPGIIALLVGPFGALAGLLLARPPRDGDGPLASLTPELSHQLGTALLNSYGAVCIAGGVLLLGAVIGKIVLMLVRQKSPSVSGRG